MAAKVAVGGGAPYCLWTKKRNIISATNQVATRANKAPPRTKPQHKQEKKTCNCSYPSTFSQATTSGEARPLHSAIVHLGRLDCAWDLRVKPKASKLFRDASKLWFHVVTCTSHVCLWSTYTGIYLSRACRIALGRGR